MLPEETCLPNVLVCLTNWPKFYQSLHISVLNFYYYWCLLEFQGKWIGFGNRIVIFHTERKKITVTSELILFLLKFVLFGVIFFCQKWTLFPFFPCRIYSEALAINWICPKPQQRTDEASRILNSWRMQRLADPSRCFMLVLLLRKSRWLRKLLRCPSVVL